MTFIPENTVATKRGEPMISLARKGANCINKAAAEKMQLAGDSLIGFHQDKDNPEDWYISLVEEGFPLRNDKGDGALYFNNVAMAHTMLDALGIEEDRCAFMLASEPVTVDEVDYWPLITAKPIIKKRNKK